MKKLLFSVTRKDLKITQFSGTGKGGQYRNRHKNCVRIQHPDSGALVTGQSHREYRANLREAMQNLVKDGRFKVWHFNKVAEITTGKTIAEVVDEQMAPENLRIEVRGVAGTWERFNG